MDEATRLLAKLRLSDVVVEQERAFGQLVQLIMEMNEDDDESEEDVVQDTIAKSDAVDLVMARLQEECTEPNEALLTISCQLIAELAKIESLRQPLVTKGVLPHLLHHLPSHHIPLATQVSRALGNICFDNDIGRTAVDEADGIPVILGVLKHQMDGSAEGVARLRVIVVGFLLNLTNNCELLQDKALSAGALDLLNDTLRANLEDEDLTNMVLLTVNSLTETDSGKAAASNSELLETCRLLLQKGVPEGQAEMVLDLLSGITEAESSKTQAASSGLCQCLVKVIGGREDSILVKMAADVLIGVICGEASMELLYKEGQGDMYSQSLTWLTSGRDDLMTLGALAIGNFARRDVYCQKMVTQGVLGQLTGVLKPLEGAEVSFTLQHAVLSTLRNLAIPALNKPPMLEAGIMEVCLTLVTSEVMAVTFKLLGVLRMLIEGQETAAVKLGQDLTFLEHLTEWCTVEAHAGVKGEATRVIASLVKNSRSSIVVHNLIQVEALPHLVTMATSEHLVMQNEALMALTIVASVALGEAAVTLRESDLCPKLLTLLKDTKMPPEVKVNVLSLVKVVSTSGQLRVDLESHGVISEVRQLAKGEGHPKVVEQARSTLAVIEETAGTA